MQSVGELQQQLVMLKQQNASASQQAAQMQPAGQPTSVDVAAALQVPPPCIACCVQAALQVATAITHGVRPS